jgi:hypothetical protein
VSLQVPEEEACAGLTGTSAAQVDFKNTFKLLSISYNLLKVHRKLGCTPFEAVGVEKLNYYKVWNKLRRSGAHNW